MANTADWLAERERRGGATRWWKRVRSSVVRFVARRLGVPIDVHQHFFR